MAKGFHGKGGAAPSPDGTRGIVAAGEWKVLPAEGRTGDVPPWPLPAATKRCNGEKIRSRVDPVRVAREREVWAGLWRTPQALMWEEQGQQMEVALYVRQFCEAEVSDAPATARAEARRGMEGLGLSMPGLMRNRWKIDPAPVPDEDAPADGTAVARKGSARDRLRVVGDET